MSFFLWIIAGIFLAILLACVGLILWASLAMAARANDVMDWTNREGDK